MKHYIIRLINKNSKPYKVFPEFDSFRKKYGLLFREFYEKEDIKLFIFDSDKKLVWGFEKNRNFCFTFNYEFNPMGIPYEYIEYDEIQKTRNQYNYNEMIIDTNQMVLVDTILHVELGSKNTNTEPMDESLINLLWNATLVYKEEQIIEILNNE